MTKPVTAPTLIRAVIIEDEKLSARKLVRDLRTFPQINVEAVLHSVQQSVEYLTTNPEPDLIFSDIVLGDGVSFQIFETVEISSFIIFTTAFDQYTLRAFKLNAIDYLLKPIIEEELRNSITKYQSFRFTDFPRSKINYSQLLMPTQQYLNRLTVKAGNHLIVLAIENILGFYTENKITYVVCLERDYATDYTLDELETLLNPSLFYRISRQSFVQINAIKHVHTSPSYSITLQSTRSITLNISRERFKGFRTWLKEN